MSKDLVEAILKGERWEIEATFPMFVINGDEATLRDGTSVIFTEAHTFDTEAALEEFARQQRGRHQASQQFS